MVFTDSSIVITVLQLASAFLHVSNASATPAIDTLIGAINPPACSHPGDFFLRILPLGASITFGQGSTDGTGYRKALRQHLRDDGWDVNMVGNRTGGSMKDNSVSGVPGYRIDEVHDLAIDSFKFQPNLVLVNAGTNDFMQNFDVENAPDRMEDLLDDLFDEIDGTTIVLSTLTVSTASQMKQHRGPYNEALREIVTRRQVDGGWIVLADMDDERITSSEISKDGIHPTDAGYSVMADIWFDAIGEAANLGMLRKPNAGTHEDTNKDD